MGKRGGGAGGRRGGKPVAGRRKRASKARAARESGETVNTKVRQRPPQRNDTSADAPERKRPSWEGENQISNDDGLTARERLLQALQLSLGRRRNSDSSVDSEHDFDSYNSSDASSAMDAAIDKQKRNDDRSGDDRDGSIPKAASDSSISVEDQSDATNTEATDVDDDEARTTTAINHVTSNDPYMQRFIFESITERKAAEMAKACAIYSPGPQISRYITPSAIGAGRLDTLDSLLVVASTSCPTQYVAELFSKDVPAPSAGALPPNLPDGGLLSARNGAVSPRVAAPWMATYGAEAAAVSAATVRGAAGSRKDSGAAGVAPREDSAHPFTPLQALLWPPLVSYHDMYVAVRTADNARELRCLAALHVVNHVVKAREVVNRNDSAIAAAAALERTALTDRRLHGASSKKRSSITPVEDTSVEATSPGVAAALLSEDNLRDGGFTRARVLVLLPFRHAALSFVRSLLRLLPGRTVMNRNRFFREYSDEDSGLGAFG